MKRIWLTAVAVLLSASLARAADHRDGPAATADPAADINDVYAWMSPDGAKVWLVMTVFPDAKTTSKFSNAVKYVFRLNSRPATALLMTPTERTNIVCTFDTAQKISCWLTNMDNSVGAYVSGDASATAGIESADKKIKVFAGLRDDPFFFNLTGFNNVAGVVKQAAGGLMFDTNGCPKLDMQTSMAAVNGLKTGSNDFKAFNALAIVISVDKALVTKGGPLLGVWASTNK
jgi:hypothetical protein